MATTRINSRMIREAGQHFAISQFNFSGKCAAKMANNWDAFDLVVETGTALARVCVVTKLEPNAFGAKIWFGWDDRKPNDWFVFILRTIKGESWSWVIPRHLVEQYSNHRSATADSRLHREIFLKKLKEPVLASYADNWALNTNVPINDVAIETNKDS